jgi:hypothetical protein
MPQLSTKKKDMRAMERGTLTSVFAALKIAKNSCSWRIPMVPKKGKRAR